MDPDELRDLLARFPERPFHGCEHVPAGAITAFDWRYSLETPCECCGRGALARHPTKRKRIRCDDCGGIMRPRGVAIGKERWVIAIDLEIPADATSEEDAGRIAELLFTGLLRDPALKRSVGGVNVRPWTEVDELA